MFFFSLFNIRSFQLFEQHCSRLLTLYFSCLSCRRISGDGFLLLVFVVTFTVALKQPAAIGNNQHRMAFGRSSWINSADGEEDISSQGQDETARAIHGKLDPCSLYIGQCRAYESMAVFF